MGAGVNAEGKIYVSAEFLPNQKLGNQIQGSLDQIAKNVKFKMNFDDKAMTEAALKSVEHINNLFNKGAFGKLELDYSGMLPQLKNFLNDNLVVDQEKINGLQAFETTLERLKRYSKFNPNFDLQKLNADELKDFAQNLNIIYDLTNGMDERIQENFLSIFSKEGNFDSSKILAFKETVDSVGKDLAHTFLPPEMAVELAQQFFTEFELTGKKSFLKIAGELAASFESQTGTALENHPIGKKFIDNLRGDLEAEHIQITPNIEIAIEQFKNNLDNAISSFGENFDFRSKIQNIINAQLQSIFSRPIDRIEMPDVEDVVTGTTKVGISGEASVQWSQERKQAELLQQAIDNVTESIKNKTQSLFDERNAMESIVDSEIKKLDELQTKIGNLNNRGNKEENIPNTTKEEFSPKENQEDFKFNENDIKEKEEKIENYNTDIQKLDNEYKELNERLNEFSDKTTRFKKEILEEEKKLNNLNTQVDNKQTNINIKNNQDSKRLNNLNKQKEELENQSKDIDATLEKLQQKKEELANKIANLRKEENDLYYVPEEQENQWYAKIAEESYIEDVKKDKLIPEQLNLKADEEALNRTYEAITSKRELQILLKEKLEEIKSINKEIHDLFEQTEDETLDASKRNEAGILMQDKMDVRSRLNLDYSKIYKQAIIQGVNEKTLNKYYNEGLELDDLAIEKPRYSLDLHNEAIQDNIELVKEQLKRRKKRIQEAKDEIEEEEKELAEIVQKLNGFDLNKIKERRTKNSEEQKAIEREIAENNDKIFEQKFEKRRNADSLNSTQIAIDELQPQDNTKSEQELQQLKEQRDKQKKIYDEKKQENDEALKQMNQLEQQMKEIQDKKDTLIQKQEELNRQEEERRKKEEETNRQISKANKTNFETKEESRETENSGMTSDAKGFISPEELQQILTLLTNIQKALGTLEDGSDVPSIIQSIKDMAKALGELNTALSEIKNKDFSMSLNLSGGNTVSKEGAIKREVISQLENQFDELNSYFETIMGYGYQRKIDLTPPEIIEQLKNLKESEDFDFSSKEYQLLLEQQKTFSDVFYKNYPTATAGNNLDERINAYKKLVSTLREYAENNGIDLDQILSSNIPMEQIVKNYNKSIKDLNPSQRLVDIFDDLKMSIESVIPQINNESNNFGILSTNAEEAAEAKRKFVEANKDVLQSIVTSVPKIEQEAEALEKVEEAQTKKNTTKNTKAKEDNTKTKDRKGYYDFEAMPNELIEQRFGEISPFPIIAKGVSLATNKLKEETQSSIELLEDLHTTWDREQQEIKDIIYDSTIENMQQEYAESQHPQYDFEPDYEDIARQAQETRKFYEEQISNDFEIKAEAKLDLIQDETGQLSLFDNILPEENWGQELKQNIKDVSETVVEGQISFQDLENAIKNSEASFAKLISSTNKKGKSFIQDTDLPNNFLETYKNISTANGEGYKATSNLRELKNYGDELKDIKTKLKVSFDEMGNLKSTADPLQVQDLLNKYDELIDKIQRLKALISAPSSQESFLLEDSRQAIQSVEKLETKLNNILTNKNFMSGKDIDITSLDNYFKIGTSENLDKVRSTVEEISILKQQLIASKDDNGNIIGDPQQVQGLIDKYNNLINILQSLIIQIKMPNSVESVAVRLAKDADKAKKELEDLKNTIDTVLGKSGLFEAQTQKTINSYGAFDGDGNGQRLANLKEVDTVDDNFKQQQIQVRQLVTDLEEYKQAIKELKTLRDSDDTTSKQLEEANNKVKALKDSITTLSQTIKASGIANATEEQIGSLRIRLESFLENTPNLTGNVRTQLQKYVDILKSGASVSKTSYNSMAADLKKFTIAQSSGTTIWDQMVGKMREGIAFLATKFSFYQIFNQFRRGFEVIHQFDDALTEMMKVSDETRLSLERYQKTTFDTADAIGTSALQIQNSTADFMRLGETLDKAAESAKSANILMNVSEFQSIDEATKSLIAMGAAYDDLSKMNIIDKLNEVGNNYAISTSEAATALQSSASALKTAGNDMDEALALVTAGNAVVQDATKVGTGMRTIALRLTGTKTAKEELEEMGEETENVITTQSKLRDTIKEATAVASNGFKGFDILDDNGNYKSTYEIMLGIADVYNEILETDKQFGRNNANLLLESVAGKNRANIAASIFQNPKLLRDAFQSSQEANGSAMRENDKYVQSISGHIAQLTNAWQEMWANAANRDVINFFIDVAKTIVNLANAVGVLPTTLALMLPYINLITKVRSKDKQGIVSQFLDWANGLNEAQKAAKEMAKAQEELNTVKEASIAINTAEAASTEVETVADVEGTAASAGKTIANEGQTVSTLELTTAEVAETVAEKGSTAADIEGTAASAAKTSANLAEAGSSAAVGAGGFGKLAGVIGGKLSAGVGRLTGAFSGLVGAIGAVPVALGVAAGAVIIGKKIYDAHRESVFNDAKAIAENIKTQQEATTQQLENYKQLKTQLDSGDLSEQETIDTKQKIVDLQKTIADQYGISISSLDLVNGKLEEQLRLIQNISQVNAENQYNENAEGFRVAEQEYNKNRKYSFKLKYPTDDIRKALEDSGFDLKEWNNNGSVVASINDDVDSSITKLNKLKQSLIETRDSYSGYRSKERKEAINEYIEDIDKQLSKAEEIRTQYEDTYLQKLNAELFKKGDYNVYQNYQSSVSDLESAYITGDTQKINEARKAFDEATKAKEDFLSDSGNEQFTLLFNKIDTSLINTKNRFRDTVEILKTIPEPDQEEGLFEGTDKKTLKNNAKAQSNLTKEQKKAYKAAKELYKLNPDKVDIKATLDNNAYASRKYADALNTLMNNMNWTTADADELINALVTAGIVQGDASDITNMASDSYNVFSSSVENAIGVLNTLNTALSESAKGTGLTEQTLTELRAAFGDNLNSVLERTANGYHLNTEGAYLLRQQQEALVSADYASSVYEQYQALDKLQEGYLKAKSAGEDTSGFAQQRQAIQNNIDKLNEQLMAFNNANSAYQTWVAKQSSEGEREMYNSVYSGYDAVKDELERGWAGEKTRSWLDLIFNDENDDSFNAWTSSAEEVKEKFDEITKEIEGTGGYSIADFFTVDDNGKSTSQGVWNFFDAVEKKQDEVDKEFIKIGEDGKKIFDFGENGDYQIADLLGMDIESVHAILRAASDAGFEVHLDQPLYSLEQLEEKAYSAKDALEEATGSKLKINLDTQNESEVDKAMQKVLQYQQILSEDTSIDPNVKTDRLQQLADLMNFLTAKKREFVEGKLFDFKILDSKELEESKKNINEISNKLIAISKEKGVTEFSKQFTIDPMLLNNVDYLQEKIDTLKEIRPNVDDSQVQYLDQLLAQLQQRVNILNETDLSGGTVTVDQFMAAEQVVDDINTKLDYAAQHKDIHFDWDADETFIQNLQLLTQLPDKVKSELGIDPDASAEDLLELAKTGELHLEVKTSGNVPKDTVQTTQPETTTVSKTVTETTNSYVNQYLDTIDLGQETREKAKKESEEFDGSRATAIFDANYSSFAQTEKEVENKINEVDGMNASPSVTLEGLGGVIGVAESMKSTIASIKGKTVDVVLNATSNGLTSLWEKLGSALSRARELSNINIHQANGTAHVYGTAFARGSVISGNAFASGNWGIPRNQAALTGELGTEIVVRDGNWFTVGDDGAEFVNLKKGDIVFNHKQSEELLENGYVTSNKGRGHLVGFANGTAYSHGSEKGAIKPTTSSKGMGGSTTGGSRGNSRNSGGNGGNNGSNNNNNSTDKAKETKNTLDEVEILISRIERQISNLDKTIGNTYLTWSTRNKGITKQLGLVSQEIKDQNKAAATYMKKANSLGLSESWKKKIQSGKFKIEDVVEKAKESGDTSDTLWDKITKYKEYYEKALAAKDAVIDLREKEGELYKQRFDNEQTYYEELLDALQFTIDRMGTYNDQLEEGGKLSAKNYIVAQLTTEQSKIEKLNQEYKALILRRDKAVESGKIKKGSEAWYEMQEAIRGVSEAIQEANTNIISYYNALNDVDWTRWEKVHDAIGGVTNELEFLYDLLNEDDMFDEQGTITNQGITAFGILAQEYDTYFREVQKYQEEIDRTQKQLADDPYNQTLVDKLKDLKEAQQDAASNAKKMKDSMVDVTEKGIKKQIDYVKQLIDDYEELLDTQKDQIDYAKKVADQQKEINQLEKQYRAIQNDTSEEGATKRQRLREQINEKRESLQETQEDRRISETKDMLSDFEESFEDFLNNKLKDVEGIVKQVISTTNDNGNIIKNTITDTATKYGYTISDTLNNTLNNLSNNLVSYFSAAFDNNKVNAIINGVNAIVDYYDKAQNESEKSAMTTRINESGSKVQNYADKDNKIQTGIFNSDGTQKKITTGWSTTGGKTYRFENGQMLKSQWTTVDGKKYYLNSSGARVTGWQTIGGKKYYFDENGVQYNNSKGTFHAINGSKYYFNAGGVLNTKDGLIQSGSHTYYIKGGKSQTGWQTIGGYQYYFDKNGFMFTGTHKINGKQYIFDKKGRLIGGSGTKVVGTTSKNSTKLSSHASGSAFIKKTGLAWTNENGKDEAIIRKSDGAILTPLNRGDSVIPNSAMKNMYKALTDPEKYLKQYTTPDIRIVQPNGSNNNSSPATVNMQFIANGVQDANKFVNDLMNNKKLEKWIQEITLGQANGNSSYKKYSYVLR